MVLDWSNQGSSLVGVGNTSSGSVKFIISRTQQGYSVGVYSGQSLLATEPFSSLEQAKSWSEQAYSQLPSGQSQTPSQIVSSPPSESYQAQVAPQVEPVEASAPQVPSSGLGASRDSGLTTSRIAAASLGGKDPVSKPKRLVQF